MRAHPDLRVWRLNSQRLTDTEIRTALQTLPSRTIVIFSPFSRDANDRQFTIQQSTRFVTENSSAPVYGLNRYALGYGIVGGKLIDGYDHGSRAGEMAKQILAGFGRTISAFRPAAITSSLMTRRSSDGRSTAMRCPTAASSSIGRVTRCVNIGPSSWRLLCVSAYKPRSLRRW